MAIKAVQGVRDILPSETGKWQRVEAAARQTFEAYGYREIRLPLFERTELFARGIGDETDIVKKEMYTFEDRGGDSITLRPEATAGLLRAYTRSAPCSATSGPRRVATASSIRPTWRRSVSPSPPSTPK